MRIAILGDFKHDHLRNTQMVDRKLHKGLVRNGHDVMPVSFRNLMMQLSPVPSKRWAERWFKSRAERCCFSLLEDYQPEIILILSFRNIDSATLQEFRRRLPQAKLWGWYADTIDAIGKRQLNLIRELHGFTATGAGPLLKQILDEVGIPGGFIPNPCDPDVELRHQVDRSEESEVLFTGKLRHSSSGLDGDREKLIHRLDQRYQLAILGGMGRKPVLGLSYFRRISGAKICVSINASNSIPRYHSDRLINYLSCGAFVLAKWVPQSNLLFRDKEHLCYFQTIEECLEMIDYYLEQESQRRQIADQGMAYAHEVFHCQRIAKDMIDLITTGAYGSPWSEFYS